MKWNLGMDKLDRLKNTTRLVSLKTLNNDTKKDVKSDSSEEGIKLQRKSFHYLQQEFRKCVDNFDEVNSDNVNNLEILFRLEDIHSQIGEVISDIFERFPGSAFIPNVLSEILEENIEDFNEQQQHADNILTKTSIKPNINPLKVQDEIISENILPESNHTLKIKTSVQALMMTQSHHKGERAHKSYSAEEYITAVGKSKTQVKNTTPPSCTSVKNILDDCLTGLHNIKRFVEDMEYRSNKTQEKISSSQLTVVHGNQEIFVPKEQDTIDIVLDETSDNSKLIIAIGGPDGEKQNIQIVLKKCPECEEYEKMNKVDKAANVSAKTDVIEDHQIQPATFEKSIHFDAKSDPSLYESTLPESELESIAKYKSEPSVEVKRETKQQKKATLKSNKGKEVKLAKEPLRLVFNPDDPKNSKFTTSRERNVPINLNDTVNLVFSPKSGEEFIFSFKVSQKVNINKKLSSSKNNYYNFGHLDAPTYRMQVGQDLLPRIKICLSKELDVKTQDTKLRINGIKHKNKKVETILNEIGVDNLLMISRPVICGKMSVLNGNSEDNIPYAVSLESLPLEVEDLKIVKQSLNFFVDMSSKRNVNNNRNKVGRKFSVF